MRVWVRDVMVDWFEMRLGCARLACWLTMAACKRGRGASSAGNGNDAIIGSGLDIVLALLNDRTADYEISTLFLEWC